MKLPILQAQADLHSSGTSGHGQDPHGMLYENPLFWDKKHLDSELERVFTICNGCRLCFNLCPSFDVMFKRIDALDPHAEEASGKHLDAGHAQGMIEETDAAKLLEKVKVGTDNPVTLLGKDDYRKIVDLCYECKLCFPKCPYVPPHEFAVDFPKLVLRAKMQRAKDEGIGFREKFLGATDLNGSLMTKIAPLANVAAHNKFNRMLMEQTIGIAKDRELPDYADETFATWWSRRAPKLPALPSDGVDDAHAHGHAIAAADSATEAAAPVKPDEVALFFTCFVNYNDPTIGQAGVEVLERAGCKVDCPEQVCCGMPKMDAGDLEGAKKLAKKNAELLLPSVRAGKKLLSPGPSCTLMLKQEYPELLGPEGKEIADATMDLSDYLLQLGRAKKLKKPEAKPGKVAFHVACHNRVQNIGYRGRDLLKWAGADVTLVDKCCGMDGTWGMKKEFFEESLKIAEAAAQKVEGADPDTVSSDCPLAGIQLRQKTGRESFHPVKLLRAAYAGEPLKSVKKVKK
ncbi:MAG: 4Fe-4S dicluster domain-containing protein [Deltaproteobacteria bacterium]|nr:4Fe-4S dicluster domain-containing protein [Deltaproteobacteria bacterium]